jgi:FAD/FMN-containing dehydrogenase
VDGAISLLSAGITIARVELVDSDSIKQMDQTEVKKASEVNEKIVEYALKKGGTCTGEHGIGIGKIKYLKRNMPIPSR